MRKSFFWQVFFLSNFLILFYWTTTSFAQNTTENLIWHQAGSDTWQPEGRAWNDTPTPFSRFPERAKSVVPKEVWELSQKSSGMIMRFKTNAPKIKVKHQVGNSFSSAHMTTVSVSGLDLYAKDKNGVWRWAGISKPPSKNYEQFILENATPELREYALYLPLYNSTVALSVGVPEGCTFEKVAPSKSKPVVYYGTSIVQGCSASRPGMTVSAMLGRHLNLPVINLGFSGNGKMEPSVCELIAEIDASVFIIDCLPNMCVLEAEEIKERVVKGIEIIRKAHPSTPVLLMEDRTYGNAWLIPNFAERNERARTASRAAFELLLQKGVKGVTYLKGENLIGEDSSIDGSHPSDLGMFRQTEILLPILKKQLGK